MLRFAEKPDAVLQTILHRALEDRRQDIQEHIDYGETGAEWCRWLPGVAKVFTRQRGVDTITRLMDASDDERVHQITDYHWLLVYDCLRVFCEVHNHLAEEQPNGMLAVGPFQIGHVDFDAIVDYFFWDTDFLIQEVVDVGLEVRREMGLSAESFGIAAGLAPHPSELEIKPWTEECWPDTGSPRWSLPKSGLVPTYPPEEEDTE